jgi:hypothetical protein
VLARHAYIKVDPDRPEESEKGANSDDQWYVHRSTSHRDAIDLPRHTKLVDQNPESWRTERPLKRKPVHQ